MIRTYPVGEDESPQLQEIKKFIRKSQQNQQKSVEFRKILKYGVGMIVFALLVYVIYTFKATADECKAMQLSTNLLLTPYILAGNISKARELAKVDLFPKIISYSGFFTVDNQCKSHLFFWFFPAMSGDKSAPLIFWQGGGPGTSGLMALFQGTGPVLLDNDGKTWTYVNESWTHNRSVIYLDNPVATGFSYTEDKTGLCYSSSSDDVADGAMEALRQFFVLFPEYVPNDFYLASSSYGGKFLPTIAWRIENDNELDRTYGDVNLTPINMKGIISISGFTDPINQIDYGDFYYSLGIIDSIQLNYFQTQEKLAKEYIRTKNPYQALELIDPLVIGTRTGPSYLQNITGINYPFNMYLDLVDPQANTYHRRHDYFLNQKFVQQALHVNTTITGQEYKSSSNLVYNNLLNDIYKSVKKHMQNLLVTGNKFLVTSGQFDLVVPHTTVAKFLHELEWPGAQKFRSQPNQLWLHAGKVVGYEVTASNITYVVFRNSGHHPFSDQRLLTLDLILRFTKPK